MSHDYTIRYTVEAQTKLEAIEKATEKLRKTLRLVAVVEAAPAGSPWWVVRLKVVEEDGPLTVTTDAEGYITSMEPTDA